MHALNWMIILVAAASFVVGIGAIVNAVRVNKERHSEDHDGHVRHGDLRATG